MSTLRLLSAARVRLLLSRRLCLPHRLSSSSGAPSSPTSSPLSVVSSWSSRDVEASAVEQRVAVLLQRGEEERAEAELRALVSSRLGASLPVPPSLLDRLVQLLARRSDVDALAALLADLVARNVAPSAALLRALLALVVSARRVPLAQRVLAVMESAQVALRALDADVLRALLALLCHADDAAAASALVALCDRHGVLLGDDGHAAMLALLLRDPSTPGALAVSRWIARMVEQRATLHDAALAERTLAALRRRTDESTWTRVLAQLVRAGVLHASSAPVTAVVRGLAQLGDAAMALDTLEALLARPEARLELRRVLDAPATDALVAAALHGADASLLVRLGAVLEALLLAHAPVSLESEARVLSALVDAREEDAARRLLHASAQSRGGLDALLALALDDALALRPWWRTLLGAQLDAQARPLFTTAADLLAAPPPLPPPELATLSADALADEVTRRLARAQRPTLTALRELLGACVHVNALAPAQQLLAFASQHYAPSRSLQHLAVVLYARLGRASEVDSVLEDLRARGLPAQADTYAHVLAMHARLGDAAALEACASALEREVGAGPRAALVSLAAALSVLGASSPQWRALAQRALAQRAPPGLAAYLRLRIGAWQRNASVCAQALASLPADGAVPSARDVQALLVLARGSQSSALLAAVKAYLQRAQLDLDALTLHALLAAQLALDASAAAVAPVLTAVRGALSAALPATQALLVAHYARVDDAAHLSALLDALGSRVPVPVLAAALPVVLQRRDQQRVARLLLALGTHVLDRAEPVLPAALVAPLLHVVLDDAHAASVHATRTPYAALVRALVLGRQPPRLLELVIDAYLRARSLPALVVTERAQPLPVRVLEAARRAGDAEMALLAAWLAQHEVFAAQLDEARVLDMYAAFLALSTRTRPRAPTARSLWSLLGARGLLLSPLALTAAAAYLSARLHKDEEAQLLVEQVRTHASAHAPLQQALLRSTALDRLARALDAQSLHRADWLPDSLRPVHVRASSTPPPSSAAAAVPKTHVSPQVSEAEVAALLEARNVPALVALSASPARVPLSSLAAVMRVLAEHGEHVRVLALWESLLARGGHPSETACFVAFNAAAERGANAVSALAAQLSAATDERTQRAVMRHLLVFYCRRYDVARAEEVVALHEARGYELDSMHWTALAGMYAQTGALDAAERVLERMWTASAALPNAHTWHALLSTAYASERHAASLERLLARMLAAPPLSEWAWEPALRHHARRGDVAAFDELVQRLTASGVALGPIAASQALVLALALRDAARLVAVVDDVLARGVALRPFVRGALAQAEAAVRGDSFGALVSEQRARLEGAMAVRDDVVDRAAHLEEMVAAAAARDESRMRAQLARMAAEHVQLDSHMYDVLLELAVALRNAAWQQEILDEMRARGVQLTVRFYSRLLSRHAAQRDLDAAERTLTMMRAQGMYPSDGAYREFVVLLYRRLDAERLQALRLELVRDRLLAARPDVARNLHNALLSVAARKADAALAGRALELRREDGVALDTDALTTLLALYRVLDDGERFEQCLRAMHAAALPYSRHTHHNVVAYHAAHNDAAAARDALAAMLEAKHEPDARTFGALLDMYARLEQWGAAAQLLDEMRRRGVSPERLPPALNAHVQARQ